LRRHISPFPLDWINDINICCVCGKKMVKEEGKPRKICENGCIEYTFEKMEARA
jgi:hypothetical protein